MDNRRVGIHSAKRGCLKAGLAPQGIVGKVTVVRGWQESRDRMPGGEHRVETLRALRQLCRGTVSNAASSKQPLLSTGIAALDALLPDGGLEPGSLVEWLAVQGSGAAILALQGVRSALEHHPVWAVVDPLGEFYPPAVQGWGIPLESLLLLRPDSVADTAWTVEQCLRSTAVGVTWIQVEAIPDRVQHRWKMAAETTGGIGVLFRPCGQRQTSRADARWLVQPRPATGTMARRLRVELLACRGTFAVGSVELDVNDATGDVCLVPAVANSTVARRAAEA